MDNAVQTAKRSRFRIGAKNEQVNKPELGDKMRKQKQIWECQVGEVDVAKLPLGSDLPMRTAIRKAYFQLTGEYPEFIFSRWNAELDDVRRSIVIKDKH
jgi:hypothetical protein